MTWSVTDVHVAETRARGKAMPQKRARVAVSGFSGRIQVDEREEGQFSTLPPENAVGSSLCYSRNNVTLRRESPAIYGNRKNANKGSLALCSCCLVLRALRKDGDTARGKRQRGRRDGVNGSSRFSCDARFLRRNEKKKKKKKKKSEWIAYLVLFYLPEERKSLAINPVMSASLCFLSTRRNERYW